MDTPTPCTEVYDLFTVLVEDYKFNELNKLSEEDLNIYLQGFLRFSVGKFRCNNQQLIDNVDFANDTFTIKVNEANMQMLALLMREFWFQKLVNNVLQFQWTLNDTDFKHYSEAQNLKEKELKYQMLREENSQLITDYQLGYTVNWEEWKNGNYYK